MIQPLVVKIGGELGVDLTALAADVAALSRSQPLIIVHGGAQAIDLLAASLEVPQQRLETASGTSSRYTNPETLDVLQMALLGRVKPTLVSALGRAGVQAVGLSGIDANLVKAHRPSAHKAVLHGHRRIIRDDHSGRIVATDPRILQTLLASGCVPVVSPPAVDLEGQCVNVDADRLAVAIAIAVDAGTLVFLTGAAGVLEDATDASSLIQHLSVPPAPQEILPGARGGMRVKLEAARAALDGGVTRVHIADLRSHRPLSGPLAGQGTVLTRSADHRPTKE